MPYRNNHYVPQWYQKGFIPKQQLNKELFYLDLKPEYVIDSKGNKHFIKVLRNLGTKKCFAQEDLYTTKLGIENSTKIETEFFGNIDNISPKAMEFFLNFDHIKFQRKAYHDLLNHMGTQKLRTPKALKWISENINSKDQDKILQYMIKLRRLYSAIWTECVWQIAEADKSETKFIISDHPVTVYNRRCGPRSEWCKDCNDPDITFQATHTLFPLSLNKVLILTNLSWIRNPYQSETNIRPNPNPFRDAVMKWTEIQIDRHLTEQEVREINLIIKSRAHRYIAAGNKEWLYPELYITKSNWNKFGKGYLLMPDPRPLTLGGEMIFGFGNGVTDSFDSYGRKVWDPEYNLEQDSNIEDKTFYRFKGEFARLFGPFRRGRSFSSIIKLDNEKDDDKYHKYHLSLENKNK